MGAGILIILIITALLLGLIDVILYGFIIRHFQEIREAFERFRTKVGRILLIVSGFFFVAALCTTLYEWLFTLAAHHASGNVIERREQKGSDGLVKYAPTFRFQDSAGVRHTVSSSLLKAPPAFHVGESVRILYLTGSPQTAHIDSFWEIWLLPILLGIMCVVLFPFGPNFWCRKLVRRWRERHRFNLAS